MKTKIVFHILLFICFSSVAQTFDTSVALSKLTIEDNNFSAFKSYFDFKPSEVEKGWWKYARQFGKPLNMRKYYQVTISREVENVEVQIILYSKPVPNGTGSSFILALDDIGIPDAKRNSYLQQTQLILMEFKRHMYLDIYEGQLEELNKMAIKSGGLANKLEGAPRIEMLEKLQVLAMEVEDVKAKIAVLQQ